MHTLIKYHLVFAIITQYVLPCVHVITFIINYSNLNAYILPTSLFILTVYRIALNKRWVSMKIELHCINMRI